MQAILNAAAPLFALILTGYLCGRFGLFASEATASNPVPTPAVNSDVCGGWVSSHPAYPKRTGERSARSADMTSASGVRQ